jgi:hypothetical protein
MSFGEPFVDVTIKKSFHAVFGFGGTGTLSVSE